MNLLAYHVRIEVIVMDVNNVNWCGYLCQGIGSTLCESKLSYDSLFQCVAHFPKEMRLMEAS